MNSFQFIPTILEEDKAGYEASLAFLSGKTKAVHIDIADDTLVTNSTISPHLLPPLPANEFIAYIHLMVSHPIQYFQALKEMGATYAIAHLENDEPIEKIIEAAEHHDLKVAISVNPATAIETIRPYVSRINFLQIMGVEPGVGGQPLLHQTVERIRQAKELFSDLTIAVDGGVRLGNAQALAAAGATMLMVGKGGYLNDDGKSDKIYEWQQLEQL